MPPLASQPRPCQVQATYPQQKYFGSKYMLEVTASHAPLHFIPTPPAQGLGRKSDSLGGSTGALCPQAKLPALTSRALRCLLSLQTLFSHNYPGQEFRSLVPARPLLCKCKQMRCKQSGPRLTEKSPAAGGVTAKSACSGFPVSSPPPPTGFIHLDVPGPPSCPSTL